MRLEMTPCFLILRALILSPLTKTEWVPCPPTFLPAVVYIVKVSHTQRVLTLPGTSNLQNATYNCGLKFNTMTDIKASGKSQLFINVLTISKQFMFQPYCCSPRLSLRKHTFYIQTIKHFSLGLLFMKFYSWLYLL